MQKEKILQFLPNFTIDCRKNIQNCATVFLLRFGHEDGMKNEQAVSSGGRDTSVRLWKVVTESQLVFNGSW